MKLKISLIALIFATILCHAQDAKLKNLLIKEAQVPSFNPNGIRLFPNPSVNQISREFIEQISNLKFEIIDVRGRLMFEKKVENTSLEKINIGTFPQCVYFIRVYSETVEDFLPFAKI
jgi:hypothetical protein